MRYIAAQMSCERDHGLYYKVKQNCTLADNRIKRGKGGNYDF